MSTKMKPALRAQVERVWVEIIPDGDGDASYLEQDVFEDRLEAYKRGDFGFIGVRACAELRYATEQGGWIGGPIVSSPGLWSIESDSGEDYLREIGAEEIDQLRDMLTALGLRHITWDGTLRYV